MIKIEGIVTHRTFPDDANPFVADPLCVITFAEGQNVQSVFGETAKAKEEYLTEPSLMSGTNQPVRVAIFKNGNGYSCPACDMGHEVTRNLVMIPYRLTVANLSPIVMNPNLSY